MIPLKTFDLREGHVTTFEGRTATVVQKTPSAGGYKLTLRFGAGVDEEVTITSHQYDIWYVELKSLHNR